MEIILFLGVIIAFDYNVLFGCVALCAYLILIIYMFMIFRKKTITEPNESNKS